MARNVVFTPAKYLCAAPNRVLIDDTEKKISEFHACGGNTILFPQLYNFAGREFEAGREKWGDSKVEYVKNGLDFFKEKGII